MRSRGYSELEKKEIDCQLSWTYCYQTAPTAAFVSMTMRLMDALQWVGSNSQGWLKLTHFSMLEGRSSFLDLFRVCLERGLRRLFRKRAEGAKGEHTWV